ncbi:MAG: radical SAM protein [Candidatus Aminicenantes bacterium]|nr:radical SAM protein [Candidatus Aminicenantes bacterium]
MDRPPLPVVKYAQFCERLNEKVIAQRIPIKGSFELTFRCNLSCLHCYCNLPLNNQDAIDKELTREEVFSILDQIAEEGCLWLLLTGGEPLLRKDFLEIYAYAKKKGFLISLFTNGTIITPKIADYLAEWLPLLVEITLYGATEEIYEKVTGIPGSFKRCQRGIELLLERKIPLGLKTMAMTLNRNELSNIREYAEGLGVKFRFDPIINPKLDGSRAPCNFRLSPEEVVKLDLADEKRVKEWREFCYKFIGPLQDEYLFNCGAGISTFHIDPYGQMSSCEMTRFQNYDLRRGSFKEGWHHFIPELLALKPASDYPCGQCELISLCGQCPGWAYLENGNPETPVEYLCQIAHLRAEAFKTKKI